MFLRRRLESTDNSVSLDSDGVIRLTYKGPQTRETLRTLTESLLGIMAEQRKAGKKVRILADMRLITHTDSSARLESKWFLEEADFDVLAIVGNRYLQPLIFFVLRDFRSGKKIVKYFTDERRASKWLSNPTRDINFNQLKPHSRFKWAVVAMIVLIAGSTLSSWFQVKHRLEVEARGRFDTVVSDNTEHITDRLGIYTEALYGFRGLFHSSDEVNEREFHAYFDSLELDKKYPGINSINYNTSLTTTEIPAFIEAVRNDRSLNPEGDPGFAVSPDENHEEHYIVTYVGVKNVGSNRGVDLADNEERRTTLQAARDSGLSTATETIRLLDAQGREQPNVKGFLVTIPVYKDDVPQTLAKRRVAHKGFLNAVFDYQKLFSQSIAESIPDSVAIQIKDSSGAVVYDRNRVTGDLITSTVAIPVAGQSFTMEIQAPKLYGVNRAERALAFYVVAFGITLAGLLVVVLWLQDRGRKRAVELASAMTEDIKSERNEAIATKNKDEAILSSIGDGVLVLDTEGNVILFNQAAERISGMLAKDVLGKPYKDTLIFQHEKTRAPADDFIRRALSGLDGEMAARTILKRKDGTAIPVADSAAPIHNAEGQVVGAVVVFRDTTREKQLERMKDELLSVASHELRTPMGAVRANVSMILEGDYGPVNKELVEPLTDIKASTVRLVELVNDLLSVARMEAGRMKFTLSEFDIQPILKGEVGNLAPLGKEKGVEILLKPGKSVIVQADLDKVKQVLNNLIGNSLKFTDQGSITVEVVAQQDKVEITVVDTGVGITLEDQKKLFGKFQQITSVQDGKPAGTGLGLYISREMVHKMGGDLWIEHSEAGKGSTFAFTLPLPGSNEATQAKQVIEQEAATHPDQK